MRCCISFHSIEWNGLTLCEAKRFDLPGALINGKHSLHICAERSTINDRTNACVFLFFLFLSHLENGEMLIGLFLLVHNF